MLGSIAYARQQYAQALHTHQQALAMALPLGEQEMTGLLHLWLAQDFQALKDYRQALDQIEQSIGILQRIHSPKHFQRALTIRSQLLVHLGNYQQALRTTQQAQQLKDSLTGLEQQKVLLRIQGQYEVEQKQQQIKTIQLQLRLIRQQRQFLGISSGLLLLLLGLSYYGFRKQKQLRLLLQQQKEAIDQRAQALAVLNTNKDKLFSLISHDLRSPLARLKYGFDSLRTPLPVTSLHQPLDQMEQLLDGVLALLTNLLDWSVTQLKGVKPQSEPVELSDAVTESVCLLADPIHLKNITLLDQIPKDIWVMMNKQQLQAILRNLIGNATKFTPVGGYIRLYCQTQTDQVNLFIKGTGIGMTEEQLERLWSEPEVRVGTQGELSTGLGLLLVKEMLSEQTGQIHIKSIPQRGTTVKVTLAATKPPN